ncbi:MAG: PEP-CTERM sorting domain-containing protein [Pirellulaceae bacterium]
MKRFNFTLATVVVALVAAQSYAGTIMKLGFSTDSLADIELVDGKLSTVDDLFAATVGDQNSEVTFLGVLSGAAAIEGDRASFTLSEVLLDGTPINMGNTVIQGTSGGTFAVYDGSNELMLSGTLGDGVLSGPIGGTATGGYLTTEFGVFTDGYLLDILDEENLLKSSLSISLTDVNDGAGFATDANGALAEFSADATANVGAQLSVPDVPEPSSLAMIAAGLLISFGAIRRRK